MATDNGPFIQGRKYKLPTKDICAVYVGTPAGGNPEFKIDMSAVLDELTPCKEEEEGDAAASVDSAPPAPPIASAPAAEAAAPPAAPGNKKGNIPNKITPASVPANVNANVPMSANVNANASTPVPASQAAVQAAVEPEDDPAEESALAPVPQRKADYMLKIDGDYYHRLFSNSPANAANRATISPQVTSFITNGVIMSEVTITDAGGTQTKKIKDAIVTIGKNEKGREIATITGGKKVTYFDIAKQAWLEFTDRLRGGSRKTRHSKPTKRSKRTVKKTKKTRRHL